MSRKKKAKQAKAQHEDMGAKPAHSADTIGWDGDFDPQDDDQDRWCDHCHNTGELDCHCGGDLCVCMNNGTYPCPHCN